MKFDPEIARALLFKIEETPANQFAGQIQLPGVDSDIVLEHLQLLAEDGLIEAKICKKRHDVGEDQNILEGVKADHTGRGRIAFILVERLTRPGHEFLADA